MSQLLSRVRKPLVCKNILRHNTSVVRWCSSMPTYPYMLLDYMLKLADSGKDSLDGHITIGKCSSKEEKHIEIKTQDIVDDVCNAMSLGYYNGALKVGMSEKKHLTGTNNVRPYIYYKPSDDTLKTVMVRLPRLPSGSVIQNIAMSSHPDLDSEDWVVAIKFYGSQIKLYRPACPTESMWTDVKAMPGSINASSSLMYSKKDQRFYVPTPGSDYMYSLDPNSKENDHPEFVSMYPNYFPEEHFDQDMDEINSSTTTTHFVEAASGEQFFTKWFFKDQLELDYEGLEQVTSRTRQFMVYRAEDYSPPTENHQKHLSYTEDIGDFCIFLGQGEPFCVRASLHPGLRANCIYFAGYNFGVYDITTRCCNIFYTNSYKGCVPLRSSEFPYWPHPLSPDS